MTESLRVKVEKNQELSVRYHPAGSDRWIFFCHGFGSDKEGSYEERAERAVKEGYNAVRFDFRGNGESDGDFIKQNLSSRIEDLKAVIDYFEPESYVFFGSSFGGKVVFHASLETEPEAIITRAPVTYNRSMEDYREEIRQKGEVEKIPDKKVDISFFEDFDTYSFNDISEEIDIPVLIFHGSSDDLVDINDSFKACKNTGTDTTLQKFHGEGHSFTETAEEKMKDMTFSWLRNVL